MFVQSITALMIASLAFGQTPVPATQMTPPATQSSPAQNVPAAGQVVAVPAGQHAPASAAQAIIVPAGTAIQLALLTAVKTRSTKVGDKVRAEVAFPVTIGTRLVIPAGTFVDGVVSQVKARPKGGQSPLLRIHFTRLVYSNGYSVALSGENTQALVLPAEGGVPTNEVAELIPLRLPGAHLAMGQGPPITQAPPGQATAGNDPALTIGIVCGAVGAFLIGSVIWAHHHTNKESDFVLYGAGWQFQIVLDSPITLDAAQVAAAATLSAN